MTKDYELTYDESGAPSHYGWKVGSRLDRIEARYKAVLGGSPAPATTGGLAGGGRGSPDDTARKIIESLDDEGRWVSTYGGEGLVGQPKFQRGFRFLNSSVFIRNVTTLSRYLNPAK